MIGRALQEGGKQKPVNAKAYEESFLTKTQRMLTKKVF
jgi:hypothetical protein